MSTNDATASSSSSSTATTALFLQEMRQKVEASLLPALQEHVHQFAPQDGFDFLQVKNSLLLSYLIDLTLLVRQQQQQQQQQVRSSSSLLPRHDDEEDEKEQDTDQQGAKDDDDDDEDSNGQQNPTALTSSNTANSAATLQKLQRLTEMKVALDKMMRGLDKKLRYPLEKLLQASTASATTFAAAAPDNTNASLQRSANNGPEDPLQYRPHLYDDDEDANDSNESDEEIGKAEGSDEDDDDDDDLAAARATLANARQSISSAKANHSNKKNEKKKEDHPRQEAEPSSSSQYIEDRQAQREQRRKRRLRTSEVAQTLRAQYGDAPEQEDVHGGTEFGKQREAARRFAEREAEKTRFEESAMVRLTTTRQEKKERKRVLRQESSNLAAIADLGHLVRDSRLDEDHDNDHDNDDDRLLNDKSYDKQRYSNGKRNKRQFQEEGDASGRGGGGGRRMSAQRGGRGGRGSGGGGGGGRGGGPKNSFQAELFGKPAAKKRRSKK